jgi:hypothetical protein
MYTVSYFLANWSQVPGTLSLPLMVYEGGPVVLVQWYTGRVMADGGITQLTALTEIVTSNRMRTGCKYVNVSRSARYRD